jgi:hypothetical protein
MPSHLAKGSLLFGAHSPNASLGTILRITVTAFAVIADALHPNGGGTPEQDFALIGTNIH